MSCVNPNDPLFKILLKEIKNPLLAEIEFDKQKDYKPGIEEVFESNPELASIGNEEQYSQYLNTKDTPIVYHGSPNYFEEFDKSKLGTYTGSASAKEGFFFGSSKDVSKSYLDKRGQTLKLNDYIKSKYGTFKNFEKKAEAISGGYEIEIPEYGFASESYIVLHNGNIVRYDENGILYINEGETIDSPSFLETLKREKEATEKHNTIKSIKDALNKNNKKDSELYKNYLLREEHLKKIFDENFGGYIDKDRSITDEPFENLFIRPFTLKLKNPLIVSDKGETYREETYYERVKKAKENGHDGLIITDTFDSKYQTKPENIYVVFNSSDIQELGSKQDIEGFKEFVGKEEEEEKVVGDVDRNDELDSYITDQLFTKLGITVPNKNNETLISQADIDTFNNAVAMNGNIQPSEYYTGINDAHKWRLNQKNLYDLVDATTGDIYLKNINLSKGVQENVDVPYTPVNEEERDIIIDSINEAVNNYRLDEILAEKGYDVNDIISNLEAASNQEELNNIINKLLNKIC